jgi:Nuclease-related domain
MMLIKERTIPMYLKQLEALLRRLPNDHPKRKNVYEDFSRRMAGYKGEQSVDYQLSFLSERDYMILHDLRLFDGRHYFQLDTLILTTRFILFLEVKNIVGTLVFDSEFGQLVRISDNKSEGLPNPMLQIYRQQMQLQKVVQTNLPIESFIIISNPQTIIKNPYSDNLTTKKIIHSANLIKKINELESIYKTEILTTNELRKLAQKMMNSSRPLQKDVLVSHQLSVSDLIIGVQCPNCLSTPMKKVQRNWECPHCKLTSADAHIQALEDYALLVHTSVTNQDIKKFLNLNSSAITKNLLRRLNLPYKGERKARKYELIFKQSSK